MKIKIDAITKKRAFALLYESFEKGKQSIPDYAFEEWVQEVLK